MNNNTNKPNLKDLSKVYPFKWRIKTKNKMKDNKGYVASCVAYFDTREIQKILDTVFGVMGWKDDYFFSPHNLTYCKLSVYDSEKNDWITKVDAGGTENILPEMCLKAFQAELDKGGKILEDKYFSSTRIFSQLENEGKSNASDAFKRACVKLGIGRFLYTMPSITIFLDNNNQINEKGNIICSSFDTGLISDYCNSISDIPKELIQELTQAKSTDDISLIGNRMSNFYKNKKWIELITEHKKRFPQK